MQAAERLRLDDEEVGRSHPRHPQRIVGLAHALVGGDRDVEVGDALAQLPDAPNIVFMAGRKFGSTGSEWLTWAMNAHVPALVAERFPRSRIVAFSTACVYPFVPTASNGAPESVPPTAPSGEYANSCVARERMFEHFSHQYGTPGRLLRLSYAIDMRYGVLHDVASKVFAGQPVDVTMGHVNVIWQGEANEQALRLLAHCAAPALPMNVSGPEVVSVRWLAQEFGKRFGRKVEITGKEAPTAWLVDTREAQKRLGPAQVPLATMMDWQADWIARSMPDLGKPTHFETRDGKY